MTRHDGSSRQQNDSVSGSIAKEPEALSDTAHQYENSTSFELATSSSGEYPRVNGSQSLANGNPHGKRNDMECEDDHQASNEGPARLNNHRQKDDELSPINDLSSTQMNEARRSHSETSCRHCHSQIPTDDATELMACVRDLKQRLERTTRALDEAQRRRSREPTDKPYEEMEESESQWKGSSAPQNPSDTRKSQWNNEIKRWKRVKTRQGSTEIYRASEKVKDVRARSSGYVLTVYDEYDHEGNRTHVSLEINSAPLLDLLRKVM